MCFPELLGNPEFRPPYPCPTSLWNSSAGRSSGLCPVVHRCERETLPEQGMQHGEIPALLPWEATAAPAENRPSTLPREPSTKPGLGREPAWGFSVSQNGFRFRAILYRKRYTADAKVSRCCKEKDRLKPKKKEKKDPSALKEREVPQHPSCLFFQYNTQLGPPYHILVDTNFINFSIKAKLDLVQSMMDCLYAKCIPCITDCVMAEIEKLGQKYRVALRIAKDPRFERLPCTHKGTYADDCLVQRVTQHKCYIVATVDRDLKRRIRKIPGVPIMYISNHR
ncbi:hypothetical protein E2I00_019715 [Balaenoptera physalus]|uniref:rRNA-processing protein FCF1 homolog n=1 Tax=Balaenoptera physalus TaxID=9770 RepID=A0A643CB81_BALPH|nr:hypothetical protein E2I00_019715 [Balaenoptera physalus]